MLKQDQQTTIDNLLKKRDVNRAEKLISKLLRATQPAEFQGELLIQRARARLIGGRAQSAIAELEKARALVPDDFTRPPVMELLADCFFARFELSDLGFAQRSDAVQAEALYQQIIDQHPDYNNLGWVYYQLGRVALTDNRVSEAVNYLQNALLMPSSYPTLTAYCYERLGFIAFYEQRDYARSLNFLSKAIDTYPQSEDRAWLVQIHLLRGRVYREMQDHMQAVRESEIALKLASSGWNKPQEALAEALLTTGELLAEIEGRAADVVTHLEQFLQVSKRQSGTDVTRARVHELLGDTYMQTGDYELAISAYNAVLTYNPHHPWEASIYYRIGRAYYQKNNFEKAVQAFLLALESAQGNDDPVDYSLYSTLGNAYFAQENYQQAAEAYTIALSLAPRDSALLEHIEHYHRQALERSATTGRS